MHYTSLSEDKLIDYISSFYLNIYISIYVISRLRIFMRLYVEYIRYINTKYLK